jgi:uncharacterized protein (DUF4415 family)
MALDHLERTSDLPPEFQQAADPTAPLIEPPKVMLSFPVDADVLAYFQGDTEPGDMHRHINGVLRYYMETNVMQEADAELAAQMGQREPEPSL